jgi:hypothetical protein
MARDEAPPFERGATYYNGETIDSNNLGGVNLEGREYTFDDPDGTGHKIVCRIVRNASGGALLPKRLAKFKSTHFGRRVDGYTVTTGAKGYPIDEYLPAAGVPNNDLFYIVVEGPARVVSTATGTPTVAIGGHVCAITAANQTASDAGLVVAQDLTGATALLAAQVQNAVGPALEALTSAQTGTAVLVGVRW